jgi:hypothetical protein
MKVVRHEHPREMLAEAEGFLVAREVESTSVLGAAYDALEEPAARRPHYLCSVHEGRKVVGAAVSVSPQKLAIACATPAAAEAIARDAREALGALPSVKGLEETSRAFAHAWAKLAGCVVSPGMQTWLYALRGPPRAPIAQGHPRLAASADRDMVAEWVRGFTGESRNVAFDSVDGASVARRWIGAKRLWLWEDGTPASMAGWGARTPSVARISMVYTPAALRGRGYASMCVAHVARVLIDEGCTTCCLFADRANPASNLVYQRLGFERAAAFSEWEFSY